METAELANVTKLLVSIISMTLIFELTGAFLLMPTFIADFGLGRSLWLLSFTASAPSTMQALVSSPIVWCNMPAALGQWRLSRC